jgi:hypothetical protein
MENEMTNNNNRTFATTVPAYFLGRPRGMYEARYGAKKAAELAQFPTRINATQSRIAA